MIYSTTTLAERFTARGVHATAGTIRELIRSGVIEARRNARGEAEFYEQEADTIEQKIVARRVAGRTAFHRARIELAEARRIARNTRHDIAATA
jgi:urease gamma subunit